MQPAAPLPSGYVPAAGPFATQGAVGAAQPTVTMTGPQMGVAANTGGRRRGFQHGSRARAAGNDNGKRGRLYRSLTRGRSRDRSGSRDDRRQPSMTPAGPQTAMD